MISWEQSARRSLNTANPVDDTNDFEHTINTTVDDWTERKNIDKILDKLEAWTETTASNEIKENEVTILNFREMFP